MNYCTKGEWVIIPRTGQIGIVDCIIKRRDNKQDGRVIVQCGAGGPFVEATIVELQESSQKDRDIAEGVKHYE